MARFTITQHFIFLKMNKKKDFFISIPQIHQLHTDCLLPLAPGTSEELIPSSHQEKQKLKLITEFATSFFP